MTEFNISREEQDPQVAEALRNFRTSVHAWSDAAYNRPRTVAVTTHRAVWRAAAGWAAGCVLLAGLVSGGVYEHQKNAEQERQAEVERQHQEQLRNARINEDYDALLTHVDTAVSRQVPTAMEPLAGLLGEE